MVAQVCDFCYLPDPPNTVRCRSFRVIDVVPVAYGLDSIDDFMACDECNRLVLANDREGLLNRARQSFISRHKLWDLNCELELRQFYKQFWENRL